MAFTRTVYEQIGNYVYRLVDPRNGETFYVGRGVGNRAFSHGKAAEKGADRPVPNRIRQIRKESLDGQKLMEIVLIHRHGLSVREAKQVEAALIDAYPGLENLVRGERPEGEADDTVGKAERPTRSTNKTAFGDFGVASWQQVQKRYTAKQADFDAYSVMLIGITSSWDQGLRDFSQRREIYEQTRFAWKININRANRADFVVSHAAGIIRAVFADVNWQRASPNEWEARGAAFVSGRSFFELPEDQVSKAAPGLPNWVGKRVPNKLAGSTRNPIRYNYR